MMAFAIDTERLPLPVPLSQTRIPGRSCSRKSTWLMSGVYRIYVRHGSERVYKSDVSLSTSTLPLILVEKTLVPYSALLMMSL